MGEGTSGQWERSAGGPLHPHEEAEILRIVKPSRPESRKSFQACLDDVKLKTGRTPEQLKVLAENEGVYKPEMKASALVAWLRDGFELGRPHAMAVWEVFKDRGWVALPKARKR